MIRFKERFRTYDILQCDIRDYPKKLNMPTDISFVILNSLEEICNLKKESNDFWEPEKLFELAEREKGKMCALLKKDSLVAFAVLLKQGSKSTYFKISKTEVYLEGLFVYPEYRGKGYGTTFLQCMFSYIAELWNAKEIKLCVLPDNTTAYKIYEKIGFKKVTRKTLLLIYKYKVPYYKI